MRCKRFVQAIFVSFRHLCQQIILCMQQYRQSRPFHFPLLNWRCDNHSTSYWTKPARRIKRLNILFHEHKLVFMSTCRWLSSCEDCFMNRTFRPSPYLYSSRALDRTSCRCCCICAPIGYHAWSRCWSDGCSTVWYGVTSSRRLDWRIIAAAFSTSKGWRGKEYSQKDEIRRNPVKMHDFVSILRWRTCFHREIRA